jgi:hypothetical protein
VFGRSHIDQLNVKFSLIRDVQPESRNLSEGFVEVASGQERSMKGPGVPATSGR